ncbi:helix-turn-helix domain-containing protein [Sphingomonas sp. C8-2]|jgi:DNA-binding IclR family transcriptional regulator|nr:helix-turn-helix domain-containing protein [Sphingomonas sp. C8-2]
MKAVRMSGAEPEKRPSKGVQSIEVGFTLVRALLAAGRAVSLKDLAQAAGMSASKAHSYMVSFKKIGLISQDSRNGLYELGPFAAELGVSRLGQQGPLLIAERAIHGLRERSFDGSMFVSIWSESGPVIVLRDEGNDAGVPFDIRVGYHSSILFTATGRVFLSFVHPAVVGPVLARERESGVAGPPPLTEEAMQAVITEVRAQGFAIVPDLLLFGLTGVAVPLFDHGGSLGAVLTTIMPTRKAEARGGAGRIAEAMLQSIAEARTI